MASDYGTRGENPGYFDPISKKQWSSKEEADAYNAGGSIPGGSGTTAAASSGSNGGGGGATVESAAPSVSPSMSGLQTAGMAALPPVPDALNGGGATPLRADLGYRTPASLQSLLSGKMY